MVEGWGEFGRGGRTRGDKREGNGPRGGVRVKEEGGGERREEERRGGKGLREEEADEGAKRS